MLRQKTLASHDVPINPQVPTGTQEDACRLDHAVGELCASGTPVCNGQLFITKLISQLHLTKEKF